MQCSLLQSRLCQLTRFFRPFRCRVLDTFKNMAVDLKENQNQPLPMADILSKYQIESFKKLSKQVDFHRFFKVEWVLVPKEPTSNRKRRSSVSKVRNILLQDANLDPETMFEEANADEEDDEEADGDQFLDLSNRRLDQSLLRQSYATIEAAGPSGLSQRDVASKMGKN